jgi:hypothetical protein
MTTLLLTFLFACGDKEEDSAVAEAEEVVEETTEETTEEEAEDTATSEEE